MSTIQGNFIIIGPGRTGSHWIEKILVDLIGLENTVPLDNITLTTAGWIMHTHNLIGTIDLPESIQNSCILINSQRKNNFNSIISASVASVTNEYFSYTTTDVEPFNIDLEDFKKRYMDSKNWSRQFDEFVRPYFSHVIDITYEDLAASTNPEGFVADKLGILYTHKTSGTAQSDSIKNPRDYKSLILNWNELVDCAALLDQQPLTSIPPLKIKHSLII
jgi:hypothetical protein